jgi:hypothetical protein
MIESVITKLPSGMLTVTFLSTIFSDSELEEVQHPRSAFEALTSMVCPSSVGMLFCAREDCRPLIACSQECVDVIARFYNRNDIRCAWHVDFKNVLGHAVVQVLRECNFHIAMHFGQIREEQSMPVLPLPSSKRTLCTLKGFN